MQEIKGKYATAVIYAEKVEQSALEQIQTLCDQPFVAGSNIRIMPDVHAGVGCTIGTTMTVGDKIVPNLVGVDIGCGMETVCLKETRLELQQLDKQIREKIPSGFEIRKTPHPFAEKIDLSKLRCKDHIDLRRAALSLGTLGSGNHFIEVDQDPQGALYLVVHSGSRHLGLQVANYYQEMGYMALEAAAAQERGEVPKPVVKRKGKKKKKVRTLSIPYTLAYVEGSWYDDYLHDMKIIQQYAAINREAMVHELVKGLKLHVIESFTTVHNYIDLDSMILRKGAVSAKAGEKLLIPINMRDGSLICIGKGNPDWNDSAPHGAGRRMSRAEAKQQFTVSAFQKEMEGIYTTSVGRGTLDECPMAYKDLEEIEKAIGPTAEIQTRIRPIYNFKAQESEK